MYNVVVPDSLSLGIHLTANIFMNMLRGGISGIMFSLAWGVDLIARVIAMQDTLYTF